MTKVGSTKTAPRGARNRRCKGAQRCCGQREAGSMPDDFQRQRRQVADVGYDK